MALDIERRPQLFLSLRKIGIICVLGTLGMAAHAQTFRSLFSFDSGTGIGPVWVSLAQGADGNFYGTTNEGGEYYSGTIFKVTPLGEETTLHTFCTQPPGCADGASPYGGMVLGTDGSFYGTTKGGGGNDFCYQDPCGTVFRLSYEGAFSTLYSFCSRASCLDGESPAAPLIPDYDGAFYGTTEYGGCSALADEGQEGCSTVFRITKVGQLTTIHYFAPTPAYDVGPIFLMQANDGNFYGAASAEGNVRNCAACGTVFEITTAGGFITLHSFSGPDGCSPNAGLVQTLDGSLYGTTSGCGLGPSRYDGGTVFRISLDGTITTVYYFCAKNLSCYDGGSPGQLMQATDGNLYGATTSGGHHHDGTIFRITPSGVLTTLHDFQGPDGSGPWGLVQGTNGSLYGVTAGGGKFADGTVFELDLGLGPFVALERYAGKVGGTGGILGQGLTGSTSVELNGSPASFRVVSDTFIEATVPEGATSGFVTVTTPSGTLTSAKPFQVIP